MTKGSMYNLTKAFALLLLGTLLLTASAASADEMMTPSRIRVNFANFRGYNLLEMKRLLRELDRNVSTLVIPRDQKATPPNCTISFTEHPLKTKVNIVVSRSRNIIVDMDGNAAEWAQDSDILETLIAVMILRKCDVTPSKPNIDLLPKWLLAGLLRECQTNLDRTIIPGIRNFPAARALATGNSSPSIFRFLGSELPPRDTPAYSAYAELGQMLTVMLRPMCIQKPGLMPTYVAELLKDTPPELAFKRSFGPTIVKRMKLSERKTEAEKEPDNMSIGKKEIHLIQTWYSENFKRLVISYLLPEPSSLARESFHKLWRVKYQVKRLKSEDKDDGKEPPAEFRECELEKFVEKRDEMEKPSDILTEKINAYSMLRARSNQLLIPHLGKMITALENLRVNKDDDYEKNMIDARVGFLKALEKQEKIEVYLEEAEAQFVPVGQRYQQLLEEEKRDLKTAQPVVPQVEKYLDGISEKLNQ